MAGPFGAANKHIVAQNIELFLRFTLHVDRATLFTPMISRDATQFAEGDRAGNRLAGQSNVKNQGIEIATGSGKTTSLFDQELRQGGALGQKHGETF